MIIAKVTNTSATRQGVRNCAGVTYLAPSATAKLAFQPADFERAKARSFLDVGKPEGETPKAPRRSRRRKSKQE